MAQIYKRKPMSDFNKVAKQSYNTNFVPRDNNMLVLRAHRIYRRNP